MTGNDNERTIIPDFTPDTGNNNTDNDSAVFEEILSDLNNKNEYSNTSENTGYTQGSYTQPPFYGNAPDRNTPPMNGNPPPYGNIPPKQNMPPQNNAPDYTYTDIPVEEKPKKAKIKAEFSDILLLFFTVLTVFSSLNASLSIKSGIAQGIIQTAFIIFVTILTVRKTKKFPARAVFPGLISLATSLSCCISISLPFEKLIFTYYIFSMYCLALTGAKGYPVSAAISFFHQLRAMVFIPIRKMFLPVTSVFRNRKILPLGKIIGIVGGFLLGIPVFAVTAILLSSGDILFNNVLTDVISAFIDHLRNFISFSNVTTIVLTILISPLLYSFLFSNKHGIIRETLGDNKTERVAGKIGFIPSSVLFGFYGIISVCYVTYLLSQIRYLLSGFTGILPDGEYTLSLYARRGFFEMSSVAIINLVLIVLGSMFTKRNKKKSLPLTYKLFASFFCVFTLILIITAIAKMALYVTELGFTEKRILVLVADIILIVTFISILLKLIFRKFPYLRIITTFAFIVLAVYCTVGTDAVISYYNTGMYLSGQHEEIHVSTIDSTDDDWFRLINLDRLTDDDDPTVSSDAKEAVFGIYQKHITDDSYVTRSVTDILCDTYLRQHKARFEGYADYYFSEGDNYGSYGYSEYNTDYRIVDLIIRVEAPDVFSKFAISNDMASADCNKYGDTAFRDDDTIYFNDWPVPAHSDTIATVTITADDGQDYPFYVKAPANEEDIDPDAAATVYVSPDDDRLYISVGLQGNTIIMK